MLPVLVMPLAKLLSRVNVARASRRVSVTSGEVVRKLSCSVKARLEPATIDVVQSVAWNVTEVVLKAVRVQPTGAAVAVLNVDPLLMRKRMI